MLDTEFVKKVLLDQHYITEEDVTRGMAYEKENKGLFLEYLLNEAIINRSTLGLAIAEFYKLAFVDLDARAPGAEEIARIPEDIAKANRLVFLKEEKDTVSVATDMPENKNSAAVLKNVFPNKIVTLHYAFSESIDTVLSHYQKELNTRFSEIIKSEKRVAPEIFEQIIKDALTYRASDVHFEPQEANTNIRFRIDGMLRLAGSISKEYYENLLNRIKIQSNLRTDEHFAPQDGAIRFAKEHGSVDLRVSIVPALNGEKVVIRILAEYIRGLTFADLGFSERHIALFEKVAKKPFGMILVSGPTGSGKTTSLYALIKKLNTPEINITTIEDPVEYRMPGANQIQVNTKTDLTFAKGLRAIVRQDPNVILVGEIRDSETAETAINAALTGHLLLSTFHANDAATSIPRLLEMDIEPFLLASTLELVAAQRLVRRICEACRYSYQISLSDFEKVFPQAKQFFTGKETTLYKAKGCAACNHEGYEGRTSLVEMIEVNTAIKDLINTRPSAGQVRDLAKANGAITLFEDGIEKVKIGVTTIEEVLRVAAPTLSVKIESKK